MHQIILKAKLIDNQEWVEGCLVIDHSRQNLFEYRMQPAESGVLYAPPINPETICQYTGLTDKNGNRIWENDIIQYENIAASIKFGFYGSKFSGKAVNYGFYVDFPDKTNLRKELGYWHLKVVVIGNTIDNPELLEEVPE